MSDCVDFGRNPAWGEASSFDWPAQEQVIFPSGASFASNQLDIATDYHHDAYVVLPDSHLTLGAQAFGYDTSMHLTYDQSILFPDSYDAFECNTSHKVAVHDDSPQVGNVSQDSARELSSCINKDLRASFPDLPAYGEPNSSSLRTYGADTCEFQCTSPEAYKSHLSKAHVEAHVCHQCMKHSWNSWSLGHHASEAGHLSFACKYESCERVFSRPDSYRRHERKHREDAKRFPCKYCKKYRGSEGFSRRDHLTQHVRNYHHIDEDEREPSSDYERLWCRRKGCSRGLDFSENVAKRQSFSTSVEYIKHVRTVHDECDFPCHQPGCDHVNGNGYFRKDALLGHLRKDHGISDFPCPKPGCDRVGGKGYIRQGDLRTHLRKVHGTYGELEDHDE